MIDLQQYDGQLQTIRLERDEIPYRAITNLNEFFSLNDDYYEYSRFLDGLFVWSEDGSPWRRWKHKEGNWTKRFANALFKAKGISMPADLISQVGNIISDGKGADGVDTYFMEIAKFSDWEAGGFEGGKDTCWWGSYNEYRLGLQKHPRGYSMLYYKDPEQFAASSRRQGIGRCWIMNEDVGAVIFNGYGIPLNVSARVLSAHLKMDYKKVNVISDAYINVGHLNNREGMETQPFGYLIFENPPLSYNVQLSKFRLETVECFHCGITIKTSNAIKSRGKFFCSRICFYKCFFECAVCGKTFELATAVSVWSMGKHQQYKVCPACAQTSIHTCTTCGPILGQVVNVWHTDRTYCEECINRGIHAVYCNGCGHLVDRYRRVKLPKNTFNLCNPCFDKLDEGEKHDKPNAQL